MTDYDKIRKMFKKRILLIGFVAAVLIVVVMGKEINLPQTAVHFNASNVSSVSNPATTPEVKLINPPPNETLNNNYHIIQTFNNCGPAALSMALSYFGINESQEKLGMDLRPYQNISGDNDDKSVTLEEMAEKAKDYDLIPYHRPVGNIEIIKLFIAYDIPVIARTWTKENEDIGHYRVIKGYDDTQKEIIQDDSLQGNNLRYSYSVFNALWEKFNFEYLTLVPKNKQKIAEKILGENKDPNKAWTKAVDNSRQKLIENPEDIYARFNLSVALFNTGDYEKSIEEFEKVENKLPFRTLWYQIEPVLAYQKLKRYDRVFELIDKILNNQNRAFSELYYIKGEIYLEQGNIDLAREEFNKAIFYNSNFKKDQKKLNSIE